MPTPVNTPRKTSNVGLKFDVDVNARGFGSGRCGFLFSRKVKEKHVIVSSGSFVVAQRGDDVQREREAASLVGDELLRRCDGDVDKFHLLCRAIRFDPINGETIKVKQITKLRFLLGE